MHFRAVRMEVSIKSLKISALLCPRAPSVSRASAAAALVSGGRPGSTHVRGVACIRWGFDTHGKDALEVVSNAAIGGTARPLSWNDFLPADDIGLGLRCPCGRRTLFTIIRIMVND